MASWIIYLFAAVGSFAAGSVLTAPGVDTYPFENGFGFGPFETADLTASAAGAVVAVVVASALRHRVAAVSIALGGAIAVGLVALPGAWPYDRYLAVVGAGLILGGVVVGCGGPARAGTQAVMSGGVVAALLTADAVAEYRAFTSASSGVAVYVEVSAQPANTAWLVLAVSVVVAAVAVLAVRGFESGPFDEPARSRREAIVGIGLPLIAVALYVSLRNSIFDGNGRWWWGLVVVPLVVGAALWLRDGRGQLLLAGSAVAVAVGTVPSWIPTGWLLIAVPVLLAAGGAWLGRRAPRPLVGVGALALVTATAIFTRAPWDDVHLVATLFVLPVAAAYTLGSALPSSSAVTTTAFSLPAVLSLPLLAKFGWTAYTPLTTPPSGWAPNSWTLLTVAVSVGAVLSTGAAMWWVGRRRHAGR